jgi:hypothetical protein
MLLGNPFMAATKSTQTLAKRQMNGSRYPLRLVTFNKSSFGRIYPVIVIITCFIPKRNSRVTGVAGTCNVVFLDKIFAYSNELFG